MQPNGTISAELEKACSQEPIHLLGTVQPHGFLMAVDIAAERIVQVSSGIVRHWPGLRDAGSAGRCAAVRLGRAPRAARHAGAGRPAALAADGAAVARALRAHRAASIAAQFGEWECLGHLSGDVAVLEWLPQATSAEQLRTAKPQLLRYRRRDRAPAPCRQDRDFPRRMRADRAGIHRLRPRDGLPLPARRLRRSGRRAYLASTTRRKFLGLRFPASDIPAQARALYLTNRLRVLADVEATPDTLVPPTLPDGAPLDQSHCMLRGLSPVHLSYLRNMGVRATLTHVDRHATASCGA